MSITLIIILVLVLIVMVLGIIMFFYTRNRIRDFSNKVFNTPNIMEGFKKQEIEFQETPKSLSSLDSVLIPKILKDFPELNIDEVKRIAENSILTYYNCLNKREVKEKDYMSRHFITMINEEIYNRENRDVIYDKVNIHRTVINDYKNKNGSCIITFQSALEYYIKEKDKSEKVQKRVNVEMIYVYDETKVDDSYGVSLNCHNCGAPIKTLGNKSCPYCGTGVVEYISKVWKVNNLYEK